MFLYRTEVRVATNSKMGLGLFAAEFIPKDSVVWKFVEGVDIKISLKEVQQMSIAQQEYFDKYGWIENNYYVASCDTASFINHSYTPNLVSHEKIVIAARDIQPEEELFEDYRTFDKTFDEYKDELV
jgi:SET domain-containing protein